MSDTITDGLAILMNRYGPPSVKELLEEYPQGTRVYGRKGTEYAKAHAVMTGHFRRCQLEGCSGIRIRVWWPDGQIRWLCTKGLQPLRKNSKHWRLI